MILQWNVLETCLPFCVAAIVAIIVYNNFTRPFKRAPTQILAKLPDIVENYLWSGDYVPSTADSINSPWHIISDESQRRPFTSFRMLRLSFFYKLSLSVTLSHLRSHSTRSVSPQFQHFFNAIYTFQSSICEHGNQYHGSWEEGGPTTQRCH
ncbi:hypothetical protein ARMGADRAFT_604424 [Armillaria gallica]|uniref:Uncharacterized protein n=1 Tax=Armillaria gallica TaxID=47427 RepID=A0A2H3D6Q0_ARMGA|nr:hypothetical protein ARMGADRAFT_604424 [Armillaria gallica]